MYYYEDIAMTAVAIVMVRPVVINKSLRWYPYEIDAMKSADYQQVDKSFTVLLEMAYL